MQTNEKDRTGSARLLGPLGALALGLVLIINLASASNPNPRVAPIHSTPHGKSYSEWAVAWWQWALSIPADCNPVADTTGEFAGESQHGPVWFVAGTFSPSAERSYTVPAGKALFMPVFVWIFGSGVFDCDPTVPGVTCDVPVLQALAAANTEAAEVVEVSIDGVPVQNVRQYRASSPGPFGVTYPENSVVGVPAGNYYPQVTDGYWLLLEPLRKERTRFTFARAHPIRATARLRSMSFTTSPSNESRCLGPGATLSDGSQHSAWIQTK